MFWACVVLLIALDFIIDFWWYGGIPPQPLGPGDAVSISGIIILMLLWPKGRVWPDGTIVNLTDDDE